MHIPIDDRNSFDFRVVILRVTRGDGHVVKEAKTHRPFRGSVMSRRTHRHKSVGNFTLHYQIDRLTSSTGAM
jgi:hypothetical protein